MEVLFGLAAIALVLAGPAGFVLALVARRRAAALDREIRASRLEVIDVSLALARLESRVKELIAEPAAPPRSAVSVQRLPVSEPPPAPPLAPSAPQAREVNPAAPIPPASAPPSFPGLLLAPRVTSPPSSPPPQVPSARPGPPERSPASSRDSEMAPAGIGTWEARIGGSWLNRIGVALLVMGIVFALGYSLAHLGPAGKAALASAVSMAMLLSGVVLERRETYRFYGRGLVGGGWAALYATAYAVHGLEATRIIESPLAGFAVLLGAGLGMILHSLRYDNQGLTGVAYALSYTAIVLHSVSAYTLMAAALLGAGTVTHLLRRRWYGLAFGGVLATFGSLFLWNLRQEVMTPQALRFGLTALAIDWIVFLVADFAPDPKGGRERRDALAVVILNAVAAGYLSYLLWSRATPATAWAPLVALGASYALTSAALRALGRRTTHPAHSLAAAVLLAFAAFEGLTLTGASWIWLAEAQSLVLLGVWLKDRVHRFFGCVLFLAPAIAIAGQQGADRLTRDDGIFDLAPFLLTLAACGCFYFVYGRLAAFISEGAAGRSEDLIRRSFSYGAFLLIVISLWVQLPAVWVAPACAVLMLLLFEISAARGIYDLRVQSYFAGVGAGLSALVLSAPVNTEVFGIGARGIALALVAAAYFTLFTRSSSKTQIYEQESNMRAAIAWGGAFLAALAVWLEARPIVVGPAWMVLALLLIEAGIAFEERHLRWPGYAALVASHISLAVSNVAAPGLTQWGFSIRAVTLVPSIAATYYVWWRLRERGSDPEIPHAAPDRAASNREASNEERFGRVVGYMAAMMVGLFVRFEFGLENASLRWSVAMAVLLALGYALRDADLRFQAYLLGGAVIVRAAGFDFQSASPVLGIDGPLLITAIGAIAYAGAGLLVRARSAPAGAPRRPDRRSLGIESRLEPFGQDIMWVLAVALAALYFYRTWSGFALIVAWAIEGLLATGSGFLAKSRRLRLSGLALLAVGLAMTLYRTFTEFDTIGRIVSFSVLGAVLLLISFTYTRTRGGARKPQ